MALSADHIQSIANLLIRAGLYVSHVDDTDQGEESELKEHEYMGKALAKIARLSNSPSVARAAQLALDNAEWTGDDTAESLSFAIGEAMAIFSEAEDEAQLPHLKRAVMYVATSVARAYREELDIHHEEFMLEGLLNRIIGAINKEADPEEFKNMNISPAEDSALTVISEALNAKEPCHES